MILGWRVFFLLQKSHPISICFSKCSLNARHKKAWLFGKAAGWPTFQHADAFGCFWEPFIKWKKNLGLKLGCYELFWKKKLRQNGIPGYELVTPIELISNPYDPIISPVDAAKAKSSLHPRHFILAGAGALDGPACRATTAWPRWCTAWSGPGGGGRTRKVPRSFNNFDCFPQGWTFKADAAFQICWALAVFF